MPRWSPAVGLAAATLAQWCVCVGAVRLGLPPTAGFALGCAAGLAHLRPGAAAWSVKALRAGLFPLSYCALAATQGAPSWIWAALAAAGFLVFPRLDRSSAPMWRSPPEVSTALGVALAELGARPARALDAGCGIGDGMRFLTAAMPWARVDGVEAAWLPWALARWRCGPAARRGDMWAAPWGPYQLIYLFLRPEAMETARLKIHAEMDPQAWVASLDFEFDGAEPVDAREARPGRVLRLYRVGDLARDDPR